MSGKITFRLRRLFVAAALLWLAAFVWFFTLRFKAFADDVVILSNRSTDESSLVVEENAENSLRLALSERDAEIDRLRSQLSKVDLEEKVEQGPGRSDDQNIGPGFPVKIPDISFKDAYTQTRELWAYMKPLLRNALPISVANRTGEQVYMLYRELETIRDGMADSNSKELLSLGQLVQKRLRYLQNPADCESPNLRLAVCDLNKACGFGCQLHHAAYCMIIAFNTRRTLIMKTSPWQYSPAGFTGWFQEPGGCDSHLTEFNPGAELFKAHEDQTARVVRIPVVDTISKKPEYFPMAVPADLAPSLKRLHSLPFSWWLGQILRYLLRPLPDVCKMLEEAKTSLKFRKAAVGIQVRRTDKLQREAKYHAVEEYMLHVEEYFQVQDLKLGYPAERLVYVASDDPETIVQARKLYPHYTFLTDAAIARSAAVASRYTDDSLRGVITDLHVLSECNFIVCTFSSQVCRMAFALKQTKGADAGDRYRSLDDIFYFGGQQGHKVRAVLRHVPVSGSDEIALKVGDVIGVAGNHWDGYGKGRNERTGDDGLFPYYKVEDIVPVYQMPTYPEAAGNPDVDLGCM